MIPKGESRYLQLLILSYTFFFFSSFKVSDLWSRLAKGNQSLESIFQALGPKDNASKDEKDKYDHQLEQLSHIPVDQWEGKEGLMGSLSKLHSTFQEVRLCLREMGEASGAPIEPPSQTKLLNACQAIPGVIFAGAPGGKFPGKIGSSKG